MIGLMDTAKQLANNQRRVCKQLNKRKRTYVVFFDFSKAFDSVNKIMLIGKLEKTGVPNYLVHLMAAFLRGTSSTVGGTTINTNVGIPQGTSLSPYAWLIMVNDLLVTLRSEHHLNVMCFADDIAICVPSLTHLEKVI